MRVKITYGADMKEVPDELGQLYKYVSNKIKNLQTQTEFIEDALDHEEMETAIALMDRMRKNLLSIDKRLSDIEMIAVGYLNHKEGESDVSVRRPLVDPTGHTDVHGGTEQPSSDTES